jgi:hypothetical protein
MFDNASMNSDDDIIAANSSSYCIKNPKEDHSEESTNNELYFHDDSISSSDISYQYPISKSNIPSYTKILVSADGKEISNKALNQAIYLSNISGAEIVTLRIMEDVDKLGDTLVNVSQDSSKAMNNNNSKKDLKYDVKGELVNAMEEKINKCV